MSADSKPRASANAISNAVGYVLITLVTIVCTPYYIKFVGNTRYGVLALVWLLFAYFNIFDFGISRATQNQLAKARNSSSEERARIFGTALLCNFILGVSGALLFFFISKKLMAYYIKVPDELTAEIDRGLPWIALLIPIWIMGGTFIATLEAFERFFRLNVLQTTGSAIYQITIVLAVAFIAPRIDVAIIAGTLGRVIWVLLTGISAIRLVGQADGLQIDRQVARRLFHYGSWVAGAAMLAPVLSTIDQFVVGSMISAQSVAFYSVASSASSKAKIIPESLARALFPRLSQYGLEMAKELTMKGMTFVGTTAAGLYAGAIFLAKPVFQLWLGREFGSEAAPIAEILFVSIWLIGLAWFPYAMSQSQGRPDLPTKINFIEAIPYLAILWLLISLFGMRGAAIAAVLRGGADTLLQSKAAGFRIRELKPLAGGLLLVIGAAILAQSIDLGIILSLGMAAACFLFAGIQLMRHPTVRSYAIGFLRKLKFAA